MRYMNQAMAVVVVVAAGCVPNGGNTEIGKSVPLEQNSMATAQAAQPAMDFREMHASIRASRNDGQVFEFH